MAQVAIVTDSNACLPKELVERYGIYIVHSSVIIGNRTYLDGVDITPNEIYELQRTSNILPTTSAAKPWELLNAYRAAATKTNSILHVCVTPNLSMMYDAALQARDLARKETPHLQIEVIDTGTAAGAQGFLALAAARVAQDGGTLAEARAAVDELSSKVDLFFTLDNLSFLARSGRVPRTAAWASSMLSIKPIVKLSNGEATQIERVRTMPKATNRLIEIMKERSGGKRIHVNLIHSGIPEEAALFRKQIVSQFETGDVYVSEFSPVMGAQTGPGLLGAAFYCDDDLEDEKPSSE